MKKDFPNIPMLEMQDIIICVNYPSIISLYNPYAVWYNTDCYPWSKFQE